MSICQKSLETLCFFQCFLLIVAPQRDRTSVPNQLQIGFETHLDLCIFWEAVLEQFSAILDASLEPFSCQKGAALLGTTASSCLTWLRTPPRRFRDPPGTLLGPSWGPPGTFLDTSGKRFSNQFGPQRLTHRTRIQCLTISTLS